MSLHYIDNLPQDLKKKSPRSRIACFPTSVHKKEHITNHAAFCTPAKTR